MGSSRSTLPSIGGFSRGGGSAKHDAEAAKLNTSRFVVESNTLSAVRLPGTGADSPSGDVPDSVQAKMKTLQESKGKFKPLVTTTSSMDEVEGDEIDELLDWSRKISFEDYVNNLLD
eukprot:GFYU01004734.1.p1 GENE.GFYU01004734.1~~GFYU01004734.1.p1  ORF type:complete len:117 (+),score=27.70 GFYU01004734.1:1-351(+)